MWGSYRYRQGRDPELRRANFQECPRQVRRRLSNGRHCAAFFIKRFPIFRSNFKNILEIKLSSKLRETFGTEKNGSLMTGYLACMTQFLSLVGNLMLLRCVLVLLLAGPVGET